MSQFLFPNPQLQMGSRAIQFLGQFPLPASHNHYGGFVDGGRVICDPSCWRCFSGGRSGDSQWDWEKSVNPKQNFRPRDAYATDGYDEEVEFGFRNATKQRIWWYDDFDAEEDEEEEDDGFGILEPAIGINWVFKVIQAFGWMIPAVIISMLLGTGPNAIIMALALPLAQSVLSLASEAFFGRPDESPRPKPKSKKRPFGGAAGRSRVRREKKTRSERGKEVGSYKSWVDANNVSAKNGNSNPGNFGGWDELDNQVRVGEDTNIGNMKETRAQEEGKISRRAKGDSPLFMRLLIAMFPLLGFWTKLL